MAEEKIPDYQNINDIPEFMQAVQDTYGVDVPINLDSNHPLSNIWGKSINVTEAESPGPGYTATGSINNEFPFNFAQSAQLKPAMNLKIEVFQPAPESPSLRGVKVTIFHLPNPLDNSTDVIVSYDQKIPPEIGNN